MSDLTHFCAGVARACSGPELERGTLKPAYRRAALACGCPDISGFRQCLVLSIQIHLYLFVSICNLFVSICKSHRGLRLPRVPLVSLNVDTFHLFHLFQYPEPARGGDVSISTQEVSQPLGWLITAGNG
jgi:hypothetical protein